ncbi:hypothetical protein ARSEF1564_000403 [Beauveria bassiana]
MAAIARDSSKILGLMIGDCAIEPPGLYMPRVEAKPLPQIPPPRRHEPATGAVHAADLVVVVASSSSDTAGVATPEVADGSFGGMHCAVLVPEPAAGECAAPVRVLPV